MQSLKFHLVRLSALSVGNKIKVAYGPLSGLEGHIMDTHDDDTITFLPVDSQRYGSLQPQRVKISEVRKKFSKGDYVRVIHGRHNRAEGFIVDMNDRCVSIYQLGQDDEVMSMIY
jgi:transcription elongation factor